MSIPAFPYSHEVTRVRRERIGVDSYGNDVAAPTTTVVRGAVTWPEESTKETAGDRDTVISGLSLLVPPGVDVRPTDTFLVGTKTYAVDGEPADYTFNPFTDSRAGTLVRLRRVTG